MKWQIVVETPYHCCEGRVREGSEEEFEDEQKAIEFLLTSIMRSNFTIYTEAGLAIIPYDLLLESVILFKEVDD